MLELKETLALLGFNGDLSEQSITLIDRELGCAFVDALWLRCGNVEARKRWR